MNHRRTTEESTEVAVPEVTNAWSHLARSASGTPIPVHSAGDHQVGFQITLIDPHRQLFLMMTQRCSICGHKLNNGLGVVVIPLNSIRADHRSTELNLDEVSDGVIKISSAKHKFLRVSVDEGEAHIECVRRGAAICPYLASSDHHYTSEVPDFPHGYGMSDAEMQEALNVTQSELDEQLKLPERIGQPSGRKFTTPPSRIERVPQDRGLIVATLILPRELTEIAPPIDQVDLFPAVDLGDPVPASVADMSIAEVMALLQYMETRTRPRPERNGPCPCASGLKAKRCHPNGLVREELAADLHASPVWGGRSN